MAKENLVQLGNQFWRGGQHYHRFEGLRDSGVKYLWLGALCDIQQAGENEGREVRNMAELHINSTFFVGLPPPAWGEPSSPRDDQGKE